MEKRRSTAYSESANWKQNKPFPLTAWSTAELAKLPRYYVMDRFWYAMSQRLDWTPRPDGFILGKEMTLKD